LKHKYIVLQTFISRHNSHHPRGQEIPPQLKLSYPSQKFVTANNNTEWWKMNSGVQILRKVFLT
jgi:hypothetical protein